MLETSANYNTIFADLNHYAETKIVVDDTTYNEDQIMSCERSQSMFTDEFSIGNTVMNQIRFSLIGVTPDELPRMSRVEVWTKLWAGDGSDSTDWLPMGVYYTLKPDYDPETGVLQAMGYDEMYKTATVPFEAGSTVSAWDNPNIRQVADHLASGVTVTDVISTNFAGIGVPLEDASQVITSVTMSAIPYNYTVREILADIAIACCGNWVIVFKDDGNGGQISKLRMIRNVDWADDGIDVLIDSYGDAITFGGNRILV